MNHHTKHDPNYQPGKPELVYDPETKLWGIVVDSVEVMSGLDPQGQRRRIYDAAWPKTDAA